MGIVKEGYDDDDDIFSQLMDHFDDVVDTLGEIDEYRSKAEDFVTDEDTKPYAITLGVAIFLCFAMMFSWLACHCFHTKKPEGVRTRALRCWRNRRTWTATLRRATASSRSRLRRSPLTAAGPLAAALEADLHR